MAAIWIANLVRFKQENYRPDRALIVAVLQKTFPVHDSHGVVQHLPRVRFRFGQNLYLGEGGSKTRMTTAIALGFIALR
jgi:hypothetical protein